MTIPVSMALEATGGVLLLAGGFFLGQWMLGGGSAIPTSWEPEENTTHLYLGLGFGVVGAVVFGAGRGLGVA